MNLSEAGSWLCSRHPELAELVKRIGAWRDGEPHMPEVRTRVVAYDLAVEQDKPVPASMKTLIPSELSRLRLLATLAPKSAFFGRLEWCVADIQGLDRTTGAPLIEDWLRCVRIGVLG